MTDVKQIRRKLWESLDMVCVRLWLFYAAVIAAVECLMVFLAPGYTYQPEKTGVLILLLGVSVAPILAFCMWRIWQIYRCCGSYFFCRTVFSSPKGGSLRDTIRFTLVLEDPEGYKFVAQTHSIFDTHGNSRLAFENYVNQTLEVAYNEETDTVVVIG